MMCILFGVGCCTCGLSGVIFCNDRSVLNALEVLERELKLPFLPELSATLEKYCKLFSDASGAKPNLPIFPELK